MIGEIKNVVAVAAVIVSLIVAAFADRRPIVVAQSG
jgi:hypothetical protein